MLFFPGAIFFIFFDLRRLFINIEQQADRDIIFFILNEPTYLCYPILTSWPTFVYLPRGEPALKASFWT